MKNQTKAPVGKLMANEVSEKPWVYLIVYFIMKLLLVVGKNAILVLYDKLYKITYFVAIMEKMLVERLASLFRNNTWKLYILSESVILD